MKKPKTSSALAKRPPGIYTPTPAELKELGLDTGPSLVIQPGRYSEIKRAQPDDPIYKEGMTVYTPPSARKPSPKKKGGS